MNGEVAASTIGKSMGEVCASRGLDYRELASGKFSRHLPRLDSKKDLAKWMRWIDKNKLQGGLVVIDPAYLAMPGLGEASSRVFDMGDKLGAISQIAKEMGILPLIVHHTGKNIPPREPMLSDISGGGWCE
jgi:hypothetical protein